MAAVYLEDRVANSVEFEDIVKYLRKSGWEFRITGTNALTSNVRGEQGVYILIVVFQRERDLIHIVVQLHDRIPPEHAAGMLRLAASINWGRDVATCDYDTHGGIVRFRTAMPVDDAAFNPAQFSSMLAAVFALAEESITAIEGLRTGRLTVDAAIEAAGK